MMRFALAYTLLAAVLAAAAPFFAPGPLDLVVRDCQCASDTSCTCADMSPFQRLRIDSTKMDCQDCMDSGKPCACAPPDAALFHCMCPSGRNDGLGEPCPCERGDKPEDLAGRGLINALLHGTPDTRSNSNYNETNPASVHCGEAFRLGKSSTCSGTHSSSAFDKRNSASRWGLLGKLLPGGRDSGKANCGKSLRLWEASTCGGIPDSAMLQCMCEDHKINGKAWPCPCNGPSGDSVFLGNKV
ncbi:alpha-fucosidase [Purpureocillium lavendulum]|uniref:Alpha-fucosidase n=1 Tax=Purpureocillium lavendulum TaxID=1247861 RepID=A0AB34FF58_9HYPO|nr:alpha-fucosidase [Purpureocillium lavendulum]